MTASPRPLRGRRLSRAVALALAPMLVPQTVKLRATVPKLPEPPQPWEGGGGTDPLHLLVLGDSMAVGVGVDDAADGLAGHVAEELTERLGRPVRWRARGRNGATARDVIRDHLDDALADPTDVVVISLGANDAMQVRSHRAFRRDIRHIVHDIAARHPEAVVLMSALPAFHHYGLLPEPLRSTLALHAQALEVAARRALERFPRAHMTPPLPPYPDDFFATDDFHPGPAGYPVWARFIVDDAVRHGIAARIPA
ncbi:MAG: SGNH/GDSL hydrolase family protein [Microcella sp.]